MAIYCYTEPSASGRPVKMFKFSIALAAICFVLGFAVCLAWQHYSDSDFDSEFEQELVQRKYNPDDYLPENFGAENLKALDDAARATCIKLHGRCPHDKSNPVQHFVWCSADLIRALELEKTESPGLHTEKELYGHLQRLRAVKEKAFSGIKNPPPDFEQTAWYYDHTVYLNVQRAANPLHSNLSKQF